MNAHFLFRGAQIAYSIKGKGRSILLIHGFLGSKEVWSDYQVRLSKNYKVICIDLAGHGESDCIGYQHSMELFAESVKALLKHLNIRKTIIAGHSLGGYVAMAFAEKYPDSVLGLAMVNSTSRGDSKQRIKSRNQLINLIKSDKEKALNLLIPSFFGLKKRNTHWQIKRYLKMAMNCNKRGIIACIEGMKIRKEREIILKFSPFPYLFIIGASDSILDSEELKKEAILSEKGSFEFLENSSHMSLFEDEGRVYKILKNFAALKRN